MFLLYDCYFISVWGSDKYNRNTRMKAIFTLQHKTTMLLLAVKYNIYIDSCLSVVLQSLTTLTSHVTILKCDRLYNCGGEIVLILFDLFQC